MPAGVAAALPAGTVWPVAICSEAECAASFDAAGNGTSTDGKTEIAVRHSVKPARQTRSVGFRCPSSTSLDISASETGPCCFPSRARNHWISDSSAFITWFLSRIGSSNTSPRFHRARNSHCNFRHLQLVCPVKEPARHTVFIDRADVKAQHLKSCLFAPAADTAQVSHEIRAFAGRHRATGSKCVKAPPSRLAKLRGKCRPSWHDAKQERNREGTTNGH